MNRLPQSHCGDNWKCTLFQDCICHIYIYILMIILIYDISIIDNNILTYII